MTTFVCERVIEPSSATATRRAPARYPRGVPTPISDDAVVAGLRARDEAVFAELVADWSRSMLRVARSFVSTHASAEEVVQETWLAVIQGIDRFEGRSSLRTWVYRILANTARKRGVKEHRTLPWSSLAPTDGDLGPTVEPTRFRGPDDQYPGGWRSFPAEWASAESAVLSAEVRTTVAAAVET